MIKKIDILGLQLDNHTVREAMMQVEHYLNDDVLNTIENISMKTLLAAEEDPVVREAVETMDLTVISEKEIMQAAGLRRCSACRRQKKRILPLSFSGAWSAIGRACSFWERRARILPG